MGVWCEWVSGWAGDFNLIQLPHRESAGDDDGSVLLIVSAFQVIDLHQLNSDQVGMTS